MSLFLHVRNSLISLIVSRWHGPLAGALIFCNHVSKTQADFGLARLTSGQPDRRSVGLGSLVGVGDANDHANPEYYVSNGGQFAPRWTAPEAAVVNGRFSEVCANLPYLVYCIVKMPFSDNFIGELVWLLPWSYVALCS
jgi:hypothetical protein